MLSWFALLSKVKLQPLSRSSSPLTTAVRKLVASHSWSVKERERERERERSAYLVLRSWMPSGSEICCSLLLAGPGSVFNVQRLDVNPYPPRLGRSVNLKASFTSSKAIYHRLVANAWANYAKYKAVSNALQNVNFTRFSLYINTSMKLQSVDVRFF